MTSRHARLVLIVAIGALFLTASLASAQGTPQAKPKKINLNTATQAELETLKGIGPALAQKIIAARPFKAVADLKNVSGISPATYDEIKGLVTVGAPAAAAAPKSKDKAATGGPTGEGEEDHPSKLKPGQIININTATLEELEALPGIGPVKAQAIIDGRPYKVTEDVMKVKGIKEKTFEKIKGFITV